MISLFNKIAAWSANVISHITFRPQWFCWLRQAVGGHDYLLQRLFIAIGRVIAGDSSF